MVAQKSLGLRSQGKCFLCFRESVRLDYVLLLLLLCNGVQCIVVINFYIFTQDSEQWDSIYTALASRCYIIAGAASRSISKVLEHRNTSTPKSHGLIISHTNQTTMSDLVEISHLLDSE